MFTDFENNIMYAGNAENNMMYAGNAETRNIDYETHTH